MSKNLFIKLRSINATEPLSNVLAQNSNQSTHPLKGGSYGCSLLNL